MITLNKQTYIVDINSTCTNDCSKFAHHTRYLFTNFSYTAIIEKKLYSRAHFHRTTKTQTS